MHETLRTASLWRRARLAAVGFGLAVSAAVSVGCEAGPVVDGREGPALTQTATPTGPRGAGSPAGAPAFRVSRASAAGPDRNAVFADVAYNPDDKEYLIVWQGDGLAGAGLAGVNEIFGQRLSAATGREIGPNFRISHLSDGGTDRDANRPRVVYNSTSHEYLVVWHGSGLISTPDQVFEVYGQRLSRAGAEVGGDFRISNTTDLGKINTSFVRASTQAEVVWNSALNQYLVVWVGMGQPEDVVKMEIFGQLLGPTAEAVGEDFRISHTTDQGNNFHASAPAVTYNSGGNQYLVVWAGGYKEESRTEVWGRALTAKGWPLGAEFRVSEVSDGGRRARAPHLAYGVGANEYLVVFQASGAAGEAQAGVSEIFGQRIDAAKLAKTGPSDFRISHMGGGENGASRARVAYNGPDKEYLVVWLGARADAPPEVHGRRLGLGGAEIGADFQISNIAAVGKDRMAHAVSLTHGGAECLVVYHGNALPEPAGKTINEVFGQRLPVSPARPAK